VRARPARLLLVGDGPERGAIEADVRRRGLADRVAFLDEQDGIAGLLRGCAALLLPSDSESFGLVALEALASGVPVVGSAVGGIPEVVRDGVTGFLLAPDDVAGMAARVVELLDPDRRAPMARAARADAVARFSPGPAVDRYEAIYRRVVGR
jgi:glycosyltransferase involved in cell wall biosynthesis